VRAQCHLQPGLQAVLHIKHAVPVELGNIVIGSQPLHLPPAGGDTGK
jgi:hypothetical protein